MPKDNLKAIRAAVKSGYLDWSDVTYMQKEFSTPFESMLAEEDYLASEKLAKSGTQIPNYSVPERKSEPIVERQQRPAEPKKQKEKAVEKKKEVDVSENTQTTEPTDYVTQRKGKARDSGKNYGLVDLFADSFLHVAQSWNQAKMSSQYGLLAYHDTPAAMASAAIMEGINDDRENFFRYANFYSEQQKKADPMLADDRGLVERHMNDEEFKRFNEYTRADQLASWGLSDPSYKPMAAEYERNLNAKGIYKPGDKLPSLDRELFIRRGMQANMEDPLYNIGTAMKAPLKYMSSFGTKFIGDVAEAVGINKYINFPTTESDRQRWMAQDERDLGAIYDGQSKSSVMRRSLAKTFDEGMADATISLASALPFAGTGSAATFLTGNIILGGAAGYSAVALSDLTEGQSKHRKIKGYEVPEELQDAHAKYGFALDYLGRDNEYTRMMPKFNDMVSGNIGSGEWFNNLQKAIGENVSNRAKKIESARARMEDLTKPSERYQERLDAGSTLLQGIGSVGASMQEIATTTSIAAGTMALYAAAGKANMSKWASKFMGGNINFIPAAATMSAIGNAYGSSVSRSAEFTSQFADANRQKVEKNIVDAGGKPLHKLSGEELISSIDANKPVLGQTNDRIGANIESNPGISMYLRAKDEFDNNGSISEETRQSLIEGMSSGLIRTNNEYLNKAIEKAYYGSREAANQYMSLIYPDMIESGLVAIPFMFGKNALNIGQSNLRQAMRSESKGLYRDISDSLDEMTDYIMQFKPSKAISGAAKKLQTGKYTRIPAKITEYTMKAVGGNLLTVPKEVHLEEVPQYIVDHLYINDKLKENGTSISALTDVYSSAVTGIKSFLGVETGDSLYDNNYEIDEIRRVTRVSTMLLGASNLLVAPQLYKDIYEGIQNTRARDYVHGNVISGTADEIRMGKSEVYVNGMSKGMQQRVIQQLREIKNNLPDGITSEEIDHEIELATKTYSIANDPAVLAYAKRGGGIGSQDHKQLVGLIMTHYDRASQASMYRDEHTQSYYEDMMEFRKSQKTSFDQALAEINEIRLKNNPEAAPMSMDAIHAIHALAMDIKAAEVVEFNDGLDSEFSATRKEVMMSSRAGQITSNIRTLIDALENSSVISEERANELRSKAFMTGLSDRSRMPDDLSYNPSELLDEVLSDVPSLPRTVDGFGNLIRVKASEFGIAYENFMQSILLGRKVLRSAKWLDADNDFIIDKHLNAYRSRVKEESDIQTQLNEIENMKSSKEFEDRRGKTRTIVREYVDTETAPVAKKKVKRDPTITDSANQIADEARTRRVGRFRFSRDIESAPATEEEPIISQDPDRDGFQLDSSDLAGESTQEQFAGGTTDGIPTEQAGGVEELSDQQLIDMANDIVSRPPVIEESTAAEESDKEQESDEVEISAEDMELILSMEEQGSGRFYAALESHPAARLLDPGSRFDKLSHTLFYSLPSRDQQKRKEKLDRTNKFLLSPDAISGNYAIYIDIKGVDSESWAKYRGSEKYIEFSASDPSTWDNATIKVSIKKDGQHYDFMLSMPDAAIKRIENGVRVFSDSEIELLRQFRSRVIGEYAKVLASNNEVPGSSVLKVAGGIFRGKAKIGINRTTEGRAIMRPLHRIKGMIDGFVGDFSTVGLNNIILGFGRGARGLNTVVSAKRSHGSVIEQNSGGMFVMKTNPITNLEERIKVDKLRVKNSPGLAEFIYKLAVEYGASATSNLTVNSDGQIIKAAPGEVSTIGLRPNTLLAAIVNFGQHTVINQNEVNTFRHLIPKQFYVSGNILHFGNNTISISSESSITPEQKEAFIAYVNDNFHWAIHKHMLWDENGNDVTVRQVFPGIASHIEESGAGVKFYDDFSISQEDLDLTWTAWLIKNDRLVSDVKDGIFEPPYLFVNDIVASNGAASAVNDSNEGAPTLNTGIESVTEQEMPVDDTAVGSEKIEDEKPGDDYDGPTIDDFANDFSGPARVVSGEYTPNPAQIEAEAKFISHVLRSKNVVEVVDDLFDVNGQLAMGAYFGNFIALARAAESGTGFHELYHLASLGVIPRKRRMKIYNEVRSTIPSLKEATNKEIEEYLAEEFRLRRLGGKNTKLPSSARTAMRKIENIMNFFVGRKVSEIERLAKDIELGIFRGSKAKGYERNEEEFNYVYNSYGGRSAALRRVSDLNMGSIKSASRFYSVVDGLAYYLMRINGVESIQNISSISMEPLYKFAGKTAATSTGETKLIWEDIYNNFYTVFAPEIVKRIGRLGLVDDITIDDSDSSEDVSREKRIYDAASFELSKSNNISAEIKFFIATIPESKHNGSSFEAYQDPLTKMFNFIPFSSAWNRLTDDLHNEATPTAMINKIQRLSGIGNDGFYSMLLRKLAGADIDMITKFWSAIYSHKHEFVNVSYSDSALAEGQLNSIVIGDSNVDRKTKTIPLEWGENLVSSNYMYTQTDKGLQFNKEVADEVLSTYKAISADAIALRKDKDSPQSLDKANELLGRIINLFNSIGISIDMQTMEYIINTTYDGTPRVDAIISIITDTTTNNKPAFVFTNLIPQLISNGGKLLRFRRGISEQKIYEKERSVQALASAYASVHPSQQEVIVQGAENKNYYVISERNYIINILDKLKRSGLNGRIGRFLEMMLGVTYNRGSIILNQIKNGKGDTLTLKTFTKMYDADGNDPGRDYKSISKVEDYIVKMSANLRGRTLALPTLADKSTYFLLFGVDVPNYLKPGNGISYAVSGSREFITFPSETLEIFDRYFNDEFNAIKAAWAKYQAANGDKTLLEEIYHYGGESSRTKKKWLHGHGNGLRFRHFDMMYLNKDVDGETVNGMVNLNELMETMMETMGEVDGMNAFINLIESNYIKQSRGNRFTDINNMLISALQSEVKWAEDEGILSRSSSNGRLNNILIDKALFENISKMYGMSPDTGAISDHMSALNLIANNMVNGIISTVEFEKVVSKDSAFYKNADDKIKRFSSLVSTGRDLRVDFPSGDKWRIGDKKTFNVAHAEDNVMISPEVEKIRTSIFASELFDLIYQSTGQYVYDVIDAVNSNNEERLGEIKSLYPTQWKNAEKYAEAVSNDYKSVDETDGSAMISPSMFRSIMIRLGRWSDYHERMFNMIESVDQSWMSNPTLYTEANRFMMQPLKMIYFGDDIHDDLNIPRLNKMAMFTIFRPIATGDLKKVYDRMNTLNSTMRPIDMIPVAQAAKIGLHNPVKLYEDKENTKIGDFSKFDVFEQHFSNLRHQLETDPHDGDKTILRTQVQKVAMSNIRKDKVYSNISINSSAGATGETLISEWKNAISELSTRGRRSVERELGMKLNKITGTYSIDPNKLLKMLRDESMKSNMPDSVVDIFNILITEGVKEVPLQAMFDDAWVESKIISYILKKTVDIETPGGMFIQMSAFGIKATSSTPDIELALNGGRRLNFMNPDGSMDAIVSIRMFSDIIPQNIKDMGFVAQRKWLMTQGIIGADSAAAAMGYRIPTQGTASVSKLRIVDVMVDNIGDTIILPSEFTKLTGSDFDIDKLFIARYNYKKSQSGRLEKVNMDDSIGDGKWSKASNAEIQNRLLDVMLAVISDPTSLNETRGSIDRPTNDLKKNILGDINSLYGEEVEQSVFAFSRPSFQTNKKIEFTISKSGIGPIALANSNHPLSQIAELGFIGTEMMSRLRLTSIHDIYGRDGIRILDWLSALINAHVDVVKDPYVIKLGVNKHTYKLLSMLIRAGVGRSTFYYLSQPIMRELYANLDRYEGKYGITDDTAGRFDNQANLLLRKYKLMASEIVGGINDEEKKADLIAMLDALEEVDDKGYKKLEDNGNVFDIEFLRNGIAGKNNPDFNWIYGQIIVLETALALAPFYNGLSNLVKHSQIDTKKAGRTFTEQRLFGETIADIKSKYNSGNSVFVNLDRYFNDTFLNAEIDNTINFIGRLSHGLLFRTTKSVSMVADKIMALIGRPGNPDILKTVYRYIDTKIKHNFFESYVAENNIDVKGMFFGDNTMAKRLFDIKRMIGPGLEFEYLMGNEFLNAISPRIKDSAQSEEPSHIVPVDKNINNAGVIDSIQNYFSDLLHDDNETISSFARDFIAYQYYSTGDNSALNTVKISEDERRSMGMYDYIMGKLNDASFSSEQFLSDNDVRDIFRNRWYDNNLVPRKSLVYGMSYSYELQEFVSNINPSIMSRDNQLVMGSKYPLMWIDMAARSTSWATGRNSFHPFVKLSVNAANGGRFDVLYELIGITTIGEKDRPVYAAVNKLGDKSSGLSIIEHGAERSMVGSNNLPKTLGTNVIDVASWSASSAADVRDFARNYLTSYKPVDSMSVRQKPAILDYYDVMESEYAVEAMASARIDSAIYSGDYSVEALASELGSIPYIAQSRIDWAVNDFAEGILSRIDEFLANALMSGRVADESDVASLEMRLRTYLEPYIMSSDMESPSSDNMPQSMAEITNHSGGAIGADSMFDTVGREFGVTNHIHYYYGEKTPLGNRPLEETEFNEGVEAMHRAAKLLNKNPQKESTINKLARNWFQVKNSTQIIAIAGLQGNTIVRGGTGWAVAMAQSDTEVKRDIFVFNIDDNKWYKWNGIIFIPSQAPILHKNFAGIGSRQDGGKMSNESVDAIREVYQKTYDFINGTDSTDNDAVPPTEPTEPTKTEGQRIYEKLPKNTVSGNVKIVQYGEIMNEDSPFLKAYGIIAQVIAIRLKNSDFHFGNPFSSDKDILEKNPSLIPAESTRDAVEKYIDWVLGSNDKRAEHIRSYLVSGELKGLPILYVNTAAAKANEPSHANALDYLINQYAFTQEGTVEARQGEEIAASKQIAVKPGVPELFESNPELANIGTQEQYSQYLDTIFPDSKVKDIVYHGSNIKFDEFDINKANKGGSLSHWLPKGYYFSDHYATANAYSDKSGAIYAVLLNLKAPTIIENPNKKGYGIGDILKDYIKFPNSGKTNKDLTEAINNLKSSLVKNGDGVIIKDVFDMPQGSPFTPIHHWSEFERKDETDALVVFEPEQIHILGSKQDIEGFKDFVKLNKPSKPDVMKTSTGRTTRVFQWYGSTYFFEFENGVVVDGRYMDGKGVTHQFSKKTRPSSVYDKMIASGEYTEILEKGPSDVTGAAKANNDSEADIVMLGIPMDLSKIGITFTPNKGQFEALNKISEWMMSGSKEPFVILGAAGTGKTSILKIVIEAIKAFNRDNPGNIIRIAAASPTNSQKKVLSTLTGIKASTVHSMLGMKKVTDMDDFVLGQEDKFVNPNSMNIPRNGIIFIDEASMLKDDLVDFIIMKAEQKGSIVLFMGDRKQLEPVKNIDIKTGKNKPSKALSSGIVHELTEVMRVNEDNKLMKIVSWASAVMDEKYSDRDVQRRTMYDENGGAVFVSENMLEEMIRFSAKNMFGTREYAENPHYAKWMSYTNRSVDDINSAIRSHLGYNKVLEVGEHIVGSLPVGEYIVNGEYYTVTAISDEPSFMNSYAVPGIQIPVYDVELINPNSDEQDEIYLKVLATTDPMLLKEIAEAISSRQKEIASLDPRSQERRNLFKKFYTSLNEDFVSMAPISLEISGSLVDVKKNALSYYYAITTHKSQGKEFTNVFVNDANLRLKVRGTTPSTNPEAYGEYKQLFYVASSRASKNLYVATNGPRYNETSPGVWTSSAVGEFDTIPENMGNPAAFDKLEELGNQSDKC